MRFLNLSVVVGITGHPFLKPFWIAFIIWDNSTAQVVFAEEPTKLYG